MRKVNFKVRNIGSEKYLSYVLDDETDFDEELLVTLMKIKLQNSLISSMKKMMRMTILHTI